MLNFDFDVKTTPKKYKLNFDITTKEKPSIFSQPQLALAEELPSFITPKEKVIPEIRAMRPGERRFLRPLTKEEKAQAVVDLIFREKGKQIPRGLRLLRAIESPEAQAITQTAIAPEYTLLQGLRGAIDKTGGYELIDRIKRGVLESENTKRFYEYIPGAETLPKWAKITADIGEDIVALGAMGLGRAALRKELLTRNISRKIESAAEQFANENMGKFLPAGYKAETAVRTSLKSEFKNRLLQRVTAPEIEGAPLATIGEFSGGIKPSILQGYAKRQSFLKLVGDELKVMGERGEAKLVRKLGVGDTVKLKSGSFEFGKISAEVLGIKGNEAILDVAGKQIPIALSKLELAEEKPAKVSAFKQPLTQDGFIVNLISQGKKVPQDLLQRVGDMINEQRGQLGQSIFDPDSGNIEEMVNLAANGKLKLNHDPDIFSQEAHEEFYPPKEYAKVKDYTLLQKGGGISPQDKLGKALSPGDPVKVGDNFGVVQDIFDEGTAQIKTIVGTKEIPMWELNKVKLASLNKKEQGLIESIKGGELIKAPEEKSLMKLGDFSVTQEDLADAVDQFTSKAVGFSQRAGKTLGFDRLLRTQQEKKLWEDMTPEERKAEFKQRVITDFQEAAKEIGDKPIDYILNRALDPLDPMAGVYKILLKKAGATITDKGIKLSPALTAQKTKELKTKPISPDLRGIADQATRMSKGTFITMARGESGWEQDIKNAGFTLENFYSQAVGEKPAITEKPSFIKPRVAKPIKETFPPPEILGKLTVSERQIATKRILEGKTIKKTAKELGETPEDIIKAEQWIAESIPQIKAALAEARAKSEAELAEEFEKEMQAETDQTKKALKGYLAGKLKPELATQGEYSDIKNLRWIFAKEGEIGFTPDELTGELQGMGFNVEGDEGVRELIKSYFSEEIWEKAERAVIGIKKKAEAKLREAINKPPSERKKIADEMRLEKLGIIAEQLTKLAEVAPRLITVKQIGYIYALKDRNMLTEQQFARLKKIFTRKRSLKVTTPTGRLKKTPVTKEEAKEFIRGIEGIVKGREGKPPKIPIGTEILPAEFYQKKIGKPGIEQYLFEPHYMFKRLGIWEEIGKPIYDAQDTYEKNIQEKIYLLNQWLKIAGKGKDISKRIWEYADGTISAEELTKTTDGQKDIAERWRNLAEEYARKLNIPVGERRPNYISHIIEDLFRNYLKDTKYPFPEDLAIAMQSRFFKSKEIFDPFLQKRLGFPIVKKDFWLSALSYIRSAERKLAFDDVLGRVNAYLNKKLIPAETVKYIKDVIDYQVLGRPTPTDRVLFTTLKNISDILGTKEIALPDDISQALGIKTIRAPVYSPSGRPGTKAVGALRELSYASLIASNIRTGIVNLTQTVGTLAKLKGPPWQTFFDMGYGHLKSLQYIFSPEGWQSMRKAGVMDVDINTFLEGTKPQWQITGNCIKDLLYWNMKFSEFQNRVSSAFAGARNKIRRGDTQSLIKLNPDLGRDAVLLDKQLSDLVNFRYGGLFRPTFSLDPIGQLIYHLNSFNFKQIQLLHQLFNEMDLGKFGKNWQRDFKRNKIEFLRSLATDDRGAFLRFWLYASLLGASLGIAIGKSGILDYAPSETPLFKLFVHLITLNLKELKTDFTNLIPGRGAVRRINIIRKKGIPAGLLMSGKEASKKGEDFVLRSYQKRQESRKYRLKF
jgi:hypothetical protein